MVTTVAEAAIVERHAGFRNSRITPTRSMRASPAGNALACHAFGISSAGVVIGTSSTANANAVSSMAARNPTPTDSATPSKNGRRPGRARDTNAVMRMCSARR